MSEFSQKTLKKRRKRFRITQRCHNLSKPSYFQDVNANSPHSQLYSFFYGISSNYLMLIKTIPRVDDIPNSHNLSTWNSIDIVRRNVSLVNHGSESFMTFGDPGIFPFWSMHVVRNKPLHRCCSVRKFLFPLLREFLISQRPYFS